MNYSTNYSQKPSFGNQGAAQAQNLRDTGIPNESILVANRPDSYAEDAKSKGFNVEHDFPKAAALADGMALFSCLTSRSDALLPLVVFLLIPDQVQPRVFNEQFAPSLKADATIVIASGYNVFYKLLNFKPTQDVVMVAPRSAFLVLLRSWHCLPFSQDDWIFRPKPLRQE